MILDQLGIALLFGLAAAAFAVIVLTSLAVMLLDIPLHREGAARPAERLPSDVRSSATTPRSASSPPAA